MAKNKEQRFVPRDDDDQTLHKVVKITGETKLKYRVMWEGQDPNTGEPWKQSFVPKQDCTNDLVDAWNEEKEAEVQESKERQPTSKEVSVSTSSKPHALVASVSALTLDMNGVKFGPPLRRKGTKQDSPKEVAGMDSDISGAKFGPPSRKKRKKQVGSPTTDINPVKGLTSSTCDRDLTIIPILSPASDKRLADFDKEVLIPNSEDNNSQGGVNGFPIGNIDIEDVGRTDEKEGEAIKMDALRSVHSCLIHEEGDIDHRGIASNEVGPLSQENLKEASPSQEVIDSGRDSSTSARTEIPSGVGSTPQSSTVRQPGPNIGTSLELSNIAMTFGVSPSGPSDTAVVVLAHQSTPVDTTTSNILNLRLLASLAANDIISVTRTHGGGFRLVWIKFRSPDNARRFKRAALSPGGASFFCEQVHQVLFDAACASHGSDSKEWMDPKGSRRKRKKKVKSLI